MGSEENARKGLKPIGSVFLLGMMLQEREDGIIDLRADCTMGAVHAFQAETYQEAGKWINALWAHAGYCEELNELFQEGGTSAPMRKRFVKVMMRREAVSVAKTDGRTPRGST